MTTGKTIALTRWAIVSKVMSLLLNMLSRLVIVFLPRSKHLLFSWLQSLSAVILDPEKIKSVTVYKSNVASVKIKIKKILFKNIWCFHLFFRLKKKNTQKRKRSLFGEDGIK